MILVSGSRSDSALEADPIRVNAVTLKPEAISVLTTVEPVLPVAPATAIFLNGDDISE